MMKPSIIPIIIGISFVGVIVLCLIIFIFRPQFYIQVQVSDLGKVRIRDKLYMNGMAIGEVKETQLTSPSAGKVKLKINKEYIEFLNESTVFTIANDRLITGRKCLLCKNCDENAPKINSEHMFTGLGRFRYELSCFKERATDIWESYLREKVIKSIEITGELSADVIKKLKEFESEHHDEFVKIFEKLKKEIKEIPPKIEKQLDELLGSGGNYTD